MYYYYLYIILTYVLYIDTYYNYFSLNTILIAIHVKFLEIQKNEKKYCIHVMKYRPQYYSKIYDNLTIHYKLVFFVSILFSNFNYLRHS